VNATAARNNGRMTSVEPIILEAVVAAGERPAIVAACEQLHDCLGVASGRAWPVEARFRPSVASVGSSGRPTLAVLSLLPELARLDEPVQQTRARWMTDLAPLMDVVPALFVCTVFRHVPYVESPSSRPARAMILERIRRLNLLAAELSRDTGVFVLDVDRAFAHLGGRALKTDFRLGGRAAAEAAGHTIVAGILAVALDDVVAPDVRRQALNFQGSLSGIDAFVGRRLERCRPTGGAPDGPD
jgi:hypothetical protein